MLVGRAEELEQVDQMLDDLVRGRGRVLRVVGDPGSGRTALLDGAARRAGRRGVRVARMRAVAQSRDSPFALVHDLLRVLGQPTPAATGESDALVAAIVDVTTQGPLLLVVDDLQDSDPASARALAAAVGRTADRSVATLVADSTMRRDREAAPASWPTLALGPLADDASGAVVRAALGQEASETVVQTLVRAVGGTPGALVAAARSLTPAQVNGTQRLPAVLPVGAVIEEAWARVLDDLPPGVPEALLLLAVTGPDEPDLLAALLAADDLPASHLSAAEARGLVRSPAAGRVEMRDPVLVAVVLARADAGRVRHLHGLAAEIGTRWGADPVAITRHLAHSTVVPDPTVADALERQARRCAADGRVAAAALALEASALLTPDPGMRRARAAAALRDRIETGVGGAHARDLLRLVAPGPLPTDDGWVHWLQVLAQPDLQAQLEMALAGVAAARRSGDHGVERALLWEAIEAARLLGRAEDGLDLAEQYAQLDRRGGASDRDELAWTADALMAAALTGVGRLAEAAELRRDVLVRADALDPQTCPLPLLLDAAALDDALLADTPGAQARVTAAFARAEAAGYRPETLWWGIRAWRAREQGSWQMALRWRDQGLTIATRNQLPGMACALLALSVELSALCGDQRRLRDDAHELRRLAGEQHDALRLLTLERALGLDALGRGDLATAAAHLQAAADASFLGRGLRDAVLASRVELVEVLVRLGETDAAGARASEVAALLDQMDQSLASAWASRVRASTATVQDDADAFFEQALRAHGLGGDPFEHARTELLYGEHLRRTRRRAEARRHLAAAEAVFTRLGARPWQQRAAGELRVAGEARPGVSSAAPDARMAALTPQERIVARAVAQGRSNREVAELLVVSPRTVESHLSRIYRKLGVSGRTALAAALAHRFDPSA